jgi:crotonobetainyl-CoA:carnitine CoA-transferase CaiB-like acyl-CoA transferase
VEHNRDDPGYDAQDPEQKKIDAEIVARVEAMIATETSEYWEQRFTEGGVPVAPILFVQELIDHPQVQANGYAVTLEHELAGTVRMQAPPWKMSESPPAAQGASPRLGRDNEAILGSLGYSAEQIAEMRAAGVVL